ncbi:hypothetical protein MLD38_008522 [Melastoma candidum]|uniref:Uncharacterized protein n=1 Tax=Melastoma candidum TaxID=119954 RepID=A0ACB9RUA7_9MYRT|nr:hypothetical protein MLD38_008522 [Melastoma candidum]
MAASVPALLSAAGMSFFMAMAVTAQEEGDMPTTNCTTMAPWLAYVDWAGTDVPPSMAVALFAFFLSLFASSGGCARGGARGLSDSRMSCLWYASSFPCFPRLRSVGPF